MYGVMADTAFVHPTRSRVDPFDQLLITVWVKKSPNFVWHFPPNGWKFSVLYTYITISYLRCSTNFYSIICNFDEVMPY